MTEAIKNRILSREGKSPACENCGEELVVGVEVISKLRKRKIKIGHPKRYCGDCRRLLGI